MKVKRNRNSGFTLIELLVVVSLIGVLTTLVMANLNSARQRGRDAERKADLRNIQTGLRLFYNDKGKYPESKTSDEIWGCDTGPDYSACEWGDSWEGDDMVYMNVLPDDPLSTQVYRYTRNDPDSYTIQACLENKSDESGQTASDETWCSSGWMYQVQQ